MNSRIIAPILLLFAASLFGGMTMESFIDSLTARHPLFTAEEYSPEIAAEEREGTLGYRDWSVAGGPYYSYSRPIETSSFGADEVSAVGINASAEKVLPSTGGRLSGSFSEG